MKPVLSHIGLAPACAAALGLDVSASVQAWHSTGGGASTSSQSGKQSRSSVNANGNANRPVTNGADRPSTSGYGPVGTAASGAPEVDAMPGSSSGATLSGIAGNAPKSGASGGPRWLTHRTQTTPATGH